jgi:hypothetical protein
MANNHAAFPSPSFSGPLLGPTSRDGRRPLAPSVSPPLSLSLLLYKVEPELPLSPFLSHCKHTRLSIPFTIAAALVPPLPSVELTSPVKNQHYLPFFFLWICTGAR